MADEEQDYVPLGLIMSQDVWPAEFFGSANFDFLNGVAYVDGRIYDDDLSTNIELSLEVLDEVSFDLPFGVAIVAGSGPIQFELIGNGSGFSTWTDSELFRLRLPRELFVPLVAGTSDPDPDPLKRVEIAFPVGVIFDSDGNFSIAWPAEGPTPLAIERCMIGNSGIIIQAADILVRLSDEDALPDAAVQAGLDYDFRGLYMGEASAEFVGGLASAIPAGSTLKFEHCFIGTGGFSGRLTVIPGGSPEGELFGAGFTFQSLSVEVRQNAPVVFELAGALHLAFFDDPLDVLVSVDVDGKLLIRLAQTGGLVELGVSDVFKFTLDKIEFEVDGTDQLIARTSGTFTPLFQPGGPHLDWPGIRLENLEIDSEGHVRVAGGWIDIPTQASLDLYGFRLEITRIGFGKTDEGRNWIGFNGALQLMEGIPAGASVEGLRIIWGGSDPTAETRLVMEGIGVEVEIPGVLRFAGQVGLDKQEFAGAVRVALPALSFEIDGQFVAGSVPDTHPPLRTYGVFLQMQLPAGIPLGPTGLAFYGVAGLFTHNRKPKKEESQGWYRNPDGNFGWYTTPVEGVTDLENKWQPTKNAMGLGAGIIVGTFPDNGYAFNGRLLLLFSFPGPVILLEGMANLFRTRTDLGGAEPNFHALLVIEPGKNITAALDAQYRFKDGGELMDIHGSAEAFYSFEQLNAWYIHIGVDQPLDRRIGARLFQLFDVSGFFMLSPKEVFIGAGWSFNRKFGFKFLFVRLFSSLEGSAKVSFHPAHYTGSVGLRGGAEACAFGICIGFAVGASISGDVFDPFALTGHFDVSLHLPWPLPNISKTIKLSWSFPFESNDGPALPVPLREAAIDHALSGNTWPLVRRKSLLADDGTDGVFEFEVDRPGGGPAPQIPVDIDPPFAPNVVPRVPADTKLVLSFARPINDELPVASTRKDVQPDRIGDPRPNNAKETAGAAYKVGYTLKSLDLQKWAPGPNGAPGTPGWITVLQGGPTPEDSERLVGEWMAGTDDPEAGYSEQTKLVINAVTPFDYTAGRSSTWEKAFYAANPGYPCPLVLPELSARFTQPLDSVVPSPFTFIAPMPPFALHWGYGGDIAECEEVIETVLGPIEQGMRLSTRSGGVVPPDGVQSFFVRLGTAKELSAHLAERGSDFALDATDNPIVNNSCTITAFDGLEPPFTLRSETSVVKFRPDSLAALEVGDRLEITLDKPSVMAEIEFEIAAKEVPQVAVIATLADGTELAPQSPVAGVSSVRFRSSFPLIVSLVVRRGAQQLDFAGIHRVSIRPPFEVTVSRPGGFPDETVLESDGIVFIPDRGPISSVDWIGGAERRGDTLLEFAIPKDDDDLMVSINASLQRLKREAPIFDPEAYYRLLVTANRTETPLGSSASQLDHNQNHYYRAYFQVIAPPGIDAPDVPDVSPNAKTGPALDDLRLYVAQTLPPAIPASGEKLLIPRAFYRGYDVAVKFAVPHTELLYLRARRSLGVRIFDVDDAPSRMEDGRVSIPTPSWERSRLQSNSESVTRWIAAINQSACRPEDLPPFSDTDVVRPQLVSGRSEEVVLSAETLHHALLVPALLHETFIAALPNLVADGGEHRLERWVSDGAANWEVDSESVDDPGLGTVTIDFVKETSEGTASLVYAGALAATAGPDAPDRWLDFRARVTLRFGGGTVGFDVRRASGGDLLRVTLEFETGIRRLLSIAGGVSTELASDTTTFTNAETDVTLVIECVGTRVLVFQDQETTPIFMRDDAPPLSGPVGLYVQGATTPRFTEIRVDDLRAHPTAAFAFDFVTSKYTNFYHHLHSFPHRIIDGAPATALTATDLAAHAGNSLTLPVTIGDGLGLVPDDEWRSFDTLEQTTLGQAKLSIPEGVEVLRVSASGGPLAVLVRSPEPMLWERTLLELSASSDTHTVSGAGELELAEVSFGTAPELERVVILIQKRATLAKHRLDWRPLPDSLNPDPPWTMYFAFDATVPELADGTQVHVFPLVGDETTVPLREPGTIQKFAATADAPPAVHFGVPGVELRLVGADGDTVVHQRTFASPDAWTPFTMQALRKLDGTALLLFVTSTAVPPTSLRMKWTFNREVGDEDLRFRQAGSPTTEIALLDFGLPVTS